MQEIEAFFTLDYPALCSTSAKSMETFLSVSNTSLPTALFAPAPLYVDHWARVSKPLTWCTLLAVSLCTAIRVTKASVSSIFPSDALLHLGRSE